MNRPLPTPDPAARLALDFRAVAEAIHTSAQVFRAAMPQTYTLPDLHKRYHGLPHPRLVSLLTTVCGYQPGKGKRPIFHLDQVLALDAAIRAELSHA